MENQEYYMRIALEEARLAFNEGEIPIGAIVVYQGEIIGRGHNTKEMNLNPFEHAEIIAMKEALKVVGKKYLDNCDLYITLEPCLMCTGAIINARIKNVYVGAENKRYTGLIEINTTFPKGTNKFNHYPNVIRNILQEDCAKILNEFFSKRREEKRKAKEES